jgi:hypothetical protein
VVKIALTEAQARGIYPDRDGWQDIQVDAMPTRQLRGTLRKARWEGLSNTDAMRAMIRDWAGNPPGSAEPAPEPDAGPS